MEGLQAGTVVLDVCDGIYQTTKHLIEQGHHYFGYIGGHDWSAISKEKRQGFLQALAEADVTFDPKLEYHGNYRMETGFEGAKSILNTGSPTAFVVENDVLAVGCIKYCLQHGISVPDQVAVTGFDDISLASMFEPSITSARHPIEQMADAAVRYIVAEDKNEIDEQIFYAEIAIRESSKIGRPISLCEQAYRRV
jgi:DNA-binding LacI/PurR family transcriptional regulator